MLSYRTVVQPVDIEVRIAPHPYHVTIADGLVDRVETLVGALKPGSRPLIVSSPLVWRLHGAAAARSLGVTEPILVPDGERYKTLQTVSRLYDAFLRAGADRSTTVVALGGGVIGDMAGFAAATFMRGVSLVQVPTTLLAQVDAAIGGKVGVNHPQGKNLIGAFHQPALVIVDPRVLATLPRREFRAGLYEVVKYGMTSSAALFDRLLRDTAAIFARDPEVLVSVIAESCRIKAAVVAADEREEGPRRVLNFGHTTGHALETVTKYRRFRHGEAVAYGMLAASALAGLRGALREADRQALARVITQLGPLPPVADLQATEVLDAMRHDKKTVRGRLHFVLPIAIGATTIVDDVTEEELMGALREIGLRG
jgi:3-dehydroquinate synthase